MLGTVAKGEQLNVLLLRTTEVNCFEKKVSPYLHISLQLYLRPQLAEEPVQPLRLRELGAVRVVPPDDGRQQLEEVGGDVVPLLARLLTRQGREQALK